MAGLAVLARRIGGFPRRERHFGSHFGRIAAAIPLSVRPTLGLSIQRTGSAGLLEAGLSPRGRSDMGGLFAYASGDGT
jgi:hypothetical protein